MPKAEAPKENGISPLEWRLVPNLVAGIVHYRLDGDAKAGGYLSFFELRGDRVAELSHARSDAAPVFYTAKPALIAGLQERGLPSPMAVADIPLPE